MPKRLQQIVADANLPVFASHDKGEPMGIHMRRCYDPKAGVSVLVNATAYPLSPISGKKLRPENEQTVSLSAAEVSELVEVATCDECGTTHRSEAELASNLNGQDMFCTICGSEVTVSVAADTEGAEDSDQDENTENTEDNVEASDNDESEEDSETVASEEDTESTEDTDDSESDNETTAADPTGTDDVDWDTVRDSVMDAAKDIFGEDNVDKDKIEGVIDNCAKHKPNDTENAIEMCVDMLRSEEGTGKNQSQNYNNERNSDDNDTSTDASTASDESDTDEDEDFESTASYNLFQSLASNYERLDVVASGGENQVFYLMADFTPVAVSRPENASESVRPLFGNPAKFQNALFASVEAEGISEDVMSDYGIEPLVINIDSNEVVEQQVQAREQELKNQYEQSKEDIRESYQQALGTAAVGINKGVFKNIDHPLRQALASELEANNVRNPHGIINKVFREHGEAYVRAVVSKAEELMDKSDQGKNEIARFVDEASYQGDFVSESSSELTERLSNGNRSVPDNSNEEDHKATASAGGSGAGRSSRTLDAVAGLKGDNDRVQEIRSNLMLGKKS